MPAYPASIVMTMTEKPTKPEPANQEPVVIPLDPEVALRALLHVVPTDTDNAETTDSPKSEGVD